MKKILVPVDFSNHTDITCRYALEFARHSGAEIKLFHTYFDQIIIADTSFPDTLDMSTIYNEELMKEIYRNAEHVMEELELKLDHLIRKERLENITVSSAVTGGELEHELKAICKDFHPDLVVMGTTGKGKTANVWGKVSSFIIDHATAPVITVPEIKNFQGYCNIMFAADLSDDNAATLTRLIELFTEFSARFHVVHFMTRSKPDDAYIKMITLQRQFGKEVKNNLIRFEVVEVEDDNQSAVDQFVSEHSIELIAFLPHKRSLFYMFFTKNITKKNFFATNIPLMAMPAVKKGSV